MGMRSIIEDFVRIVAATTSAADLAEPIDAMARRMGFSRYALAHHVPLPPASDQAIRLHNYPDDWVDFFDRQGLGLSDPIHRASQVTATGFRWTNVPAMIQLTEVDRRVLRAARGYGIGDGFTVPANVPGEAHGSCSFAVAPGLPLPVDTLPLAQLVGTFAFEGARRLWQVRGPNGPPAPTITDRQRDCLVWVARGKTDWEISRILGVSHATVVQHIKQARERYGVQNRTSLVIRALLDGTISFIDILRR